MIIALTPPITCGSVYISNKFWWIKKFLLVSILILTWSFTKKKLAHPIECLSLTLEEVTHIRQVLTKAELETLITNHEMYNLVSKGKVRSQHRQCLHRNLIYTDYWKIFCWRLWPYEPLSFLSQVCFTCKLVKFSMFGQWGTRCKICKRNVCNNCLRKVWNYTESQ